MEFFNDSDIKQVERLYKIETFDAEDRAEVSGKIGGIKRRAKQRAIIEFCRKINLHDVSLTVMKKLMRQMFGVAVSNNALMEWARKGRKANNRVDQDAFFDSIKTDTFDAAKDMILRFELEWKKVKEAAKKPRNENDSTGG